MAAGPLMASCPCPQALIPQDSSPLNAEAIAEAFIAVDDTAAHDAESIRRAWPGRVKGLVLGVARQAFEGVEARDW